MDSSTFETDEPLTPAGRLFLRPEINQIIHCVIGVRDSIDVDSVKSQIAGSVMVQHPRFSSLLVRDRNGVEYWRRTSIEVDRHVIVVAEPVLDDGASDEKAVNEYLADLAINSSMDADKPLWEIHLLLAHKCAIFRIHHALGDGISLMSMFLTCCRRADDPNALPTIVLDSRPARKTRRWRWAEEIPKMLLAVWFNFLFVAEFILRALWVSDRKSPISGGDGVELWPRKMATAKFAVEDMKAVKKAVANVTMNDVLFSVIGAGLSRYLEHRQPKGLKEGLQLTGVAMVNLREQRGLQELTQMMKGNRGFGWGNKLGILLLPVNYEKKTLDPLQCVVRTKKMLDRKKRSFEAHFSYGVGKLIMSYLGPKVACILNYRIVCNTSFTISNVIGPREEITIGGNPITYIRSTSTSLPHTITMHMVSYAGRAEMQILVAKDIIPDPEFLAECLENALLEMKTAATIFQTK
ncbi:O-acyltransferase WSD1-like [Cucurbita maxima]|uniref:O-acyltransferase WSD1-like n=1 Tax=Cucurbita maxima TaxID=3661 RepID=A0A6J1I646_CUCMA|nr:O-acyltransferase WSD1-like [Cucurbita maxima]